MATTDHPAFPQPANLSSSVWRYLDLTKFIYLLQKKSLYFRRIDAFDDKYEGMHTHAMHDAIDIYAAQNVEAYRKMGQEIDLLVSKSLVNQLFSFIKDQRKVTFINCWHMNDDESHAMWKLYTQHQESIAIRTSYADLTDALPDNIYIGCVSYIDYKKQYISTLNLLNVSMHKRLSFEHEKELRALYAGFPGDKVDFPLIGEFGISVNIDLSRIIQSVYISPNSSSQFLEIVEGLLEIYNVKAPVYQSGVNAPPPY